MIRNIFLTNIKYTCFLNEMKFSSFLFNLSLTIWCSVPFDEPHRSRWIEAIRTFQMFDNTVANYHVCSLHFLAEDINVSGKRKTIIPGKVPSIFPQKSLPSIDDSTLNSREENNNSQVLFTDDQSNDLGSDAVGTDPHENEPFTYYEYEVTVDDIGENFVECEPVSSADSIDEEYVSKCFAITICGEQRL